MNIDTHYNYVIKAIGDCTINQNNLPDIILCEGSHQENVSAERFCEQCSQCICNECAIENHYDHIGEARNKITQILNLGKNDLKCFAAQMENKINDSLIGKKLDEKKRGILQKIEDSYNQVLKEEELLRLNLEMILETEKILKQKLNNFVKNTVAESCISNPTISIFNNKIKLINDIIKCWDTDSKIEKMKKFKIMKNLKNDFIKDIESVDTTYDSVDLENINLGRLEKEVSIWLDRKSTGIKLSEISVAIIELSSKLKKMSEDIGKITFPKALTKSLRPPDVILPTPTATGFNYLVSLKAKTQELLLINLISEEKLPVSIKIDNYSNYDFPVEHSKFVNIGNGILLTGGIKKNYSTPSSECFKIEVNISLNNYTIVINRYNPMISKRERHNIIYLDDINSILVCGGFYLKSAEITNLKEGSWYQIVEMKDNRANSTMAYVNNKYVFCFGGFQVEGREKNSTGYYLGSCEFIDIKTKEAKWSFIDLEKLFQVNLQICAMGVINLNDKKILLVGGYDGNKYLGELREIYFDFDKEINITNIKKRNGDSKGLIFPSSANFVKSGNIFLNFDSKSRFTIYEIEDKKLSIRF